MNTWKEGLLLALVIFAGLFAMFWCAYSFAVGSTCHGLIEFRYLMPVCVEGS